MLTRIVSDRVVVIEELGVPSMVSARLWLLRAHGHGGCGTVTVPPVRAAEGQGRHPFTRVYPSRVRAKGAQSGGRVRVRVRVRVSQGCRRFAKGDGRRGTKLGPGVPKLGPLGPRGILSTRRH